MPFSHYLSVLAAAVAAMILGFVWYSPLLFAKPWARAHGHTPEKLAAMQKTAGPAYAGSFLAVLVTASMLRLFLDHLGADSIPDGVSWSFHAWLGFALPIGFSANLFSDKPRAAFLIDTGYQLVYFVAMGVILEAWR